MALTSIVEGFRATSVPYVRNLYRFGFAGDESNSQHGHSHGPGGTCGYDTYIK